MNETNEKNEMNSEVQERLTSKKARMEAALALKEPDRVPINISGGTFMLAEAGYNSAQVNFDESFEMIKDAAKKFMLKYDPDVVSTLAGSFAGEGRGHEMQGVKTMFIAGMKNLPITMSDESGPQFLEQVMLKDEEFDMFMNDYTKWTMNKFFPRISSVLEPFATFDVPVSHRNILEVAKQFSRPDIKAAIEKMWEISDYYQDFNKRLGAASREIGELGFPSFAGGGRSIVPFDRYSDVFRGFFLTLTDVYEYEEEVLAYIDKFQVGNLENIRKFNQDGKKNGKFMSMALHKGFDGMLNDEQYANFYWRHLKECIETGYATGVMPQVFCEGKYMTRLKYLADITPGACYYTFEDMDMKATKEALQGKACIGGGFPSALLSFGTKEQVQDEVKKMLDDCAPGGGFIFGLSAGLNFDAKVENVEVMFDTVQTYGKY